VPKPPSLTPLTDDAQTKPATTLLARLKLWAAWGLGAGLLAWLLSHTPVSQVRDALARPGMGTWALTLGGLLLSYGLRAARLQVVLDLDGHHCASSSCTTPPSTCCPCARVS